MKLCLAKGIIIPFAYNSSESGSGHISHRNLIRLVIVFVVVCVHIYSQLHCFSLVRSTVIGGELSVDISPKYVSFINICFGIAFQKCDTLYKIYYSLGNKFASPVIILHL